MSHTTRFELWWREVNQLSWTIELFSDAVEYLKRKSELERNFADAFSQYVEILPLRSKT
jgi:hypothetical protein